MRNAFRIGRIFGIDLRIDSSWLFIFLLVLWSLSSLFAGWHPDWPTFTSFFVAAIAALLFFGSVLFHELAHAIVARWHGMTVRDITLHMFGGVSNIERDPPTPGAEFLIAIVGPITSVALGIAMLFGTTLLGGFDHLQSANVEGAADAISRLGPVTTLLVWLGPVNVAVGLFNLIPGFPLDGGRILRSLLWKLSGSLADATRWAAGVGQVVGWGFIVLGGFMAFGYRVPFFGSGLVGGLWLALIGFFLRNAAVQQYIGTTIADALAGLRVADIMRTRGAWVPADLPAQTLVHEGFLRNEDRAYPVFEDSRFVGLVCLDDVRRVPTNRWNSITAREMMTDAARLTVVAPDEEAFEALRKLGAANVRQLPVIAQGNLVGIVHEQDILRWLELRSGHPRGPSFGGLVPRRTAPSTGA